MNYFGVPLLPGGVSWTADFHTLDEQLAAFAQTDFKLTRQLKLTAGVRVSRNELSFNASYGGPENNLNYARGMPCVPNTYCSDPVTDTVPISAYAPGTGPFAAAYPGSGAQRTETSVTPKAGLSYQLNDANLLYATAAKGFRPTGASIRVPDTQCGYDLIGLGYVDANGNPKQPEVFRSDSVWSYELGAKSRPFDGRVSIDASVYRIRWSDIQTVIELPCAYNFVDNVGHATSTGFDLGVAMKPVDNLTLSAILGYGRVAFDQDSATSSGTVLFRKGSGVPGAGAPWTASLIGQYDLRLFRRSVYLRPDYSFSSKERRAGVTDAGSANFDPQRAPLEAYSVLNMRIGARVFGADLSLFVNNLTNSHPDLALRRHDSTIGNDYVWTNMTLRPRTYGLTMTYRN